MISAEVVTQTVQRMSAMQPVEARALVKRLGKAQPVIVAYLLAVSENKAFDPDNAPIRDENLGLAFLHLKIVLDAFVGE